MIASSEEFLIIHKGDMINLTCQDSSWVIDSGATIHATSKKNFFSPYTPREETSTLYMMQAKVSKEFLNAIDSDSTIELWHNRLGHMGQKGLQHLAKQGLLQGVKLANLKRCVHCLAGKQNRASF
ncbi:hypothetical protein Pint_05739 [Pistacia integerrima]|uniref:Uncharacterized protein n=1 Tax=Pistacia integerrima TaxID=434235 RepID=A0ACC0Z3M0_9ROSI|nr:hypothetical protein Pint_05739 [Pistacia integerrima]